MTRPAKTNGDVNKTAPKPFIFVLMPFDQEFDDIYKFGIKGAAEDVLAYAERVDEQLYTEGILERIFNQINKADVIVADMTGRNANVFYEVGYAHALDKVVLLLTQKVEDIPFDLQHRPHIIYGGRIEKLRTDLAERLKWAIEEAKLRSSEEEGFYSLIVSLGGLTLSEDAKFSEVPSYAFSLKKDSRGQLIFHVRNDGPDISDTISHIYLLTEENCPAKLEHQENYFAVSGFGQRYGAPQAYSTALKTSEMDQKNLGLSKQYRIAGSLSSIPRGAVESLSVLLVLDQTLTESNSSKFLLRLHTDRGPLDYRFKVTFLPTEDPMRAIPAKPDESSSQ